MSSSKWLFDLAARRSRAVGSRGRKNRRGNIGVTFHVLNNKGDRFSRQVARGKRVYSGRGRPKNALTFQVGARRNRGKGKYPGTRKQKLLPKSISKAVSKNSPIQVTYNNNSVHQRGLINTGRVTNNTRLTANFRMSNTIKWGAAAGAGGLGITYMMNRRNDKRKKRK